MAFHSLHTPMIGYYYLICHTCSYLYPGNLYDTIAQSSQHMALCFQVTALIQDPHGYFDGPGFGSGAYEFVSKRLVK